MNLDKIRDAQKRIMGRVYHTPIVSSRHLSEQTGAEVLLKAELFQKTGSFKPRGAVNKIKSLTSDQKRAGIVSVSAGNHAQAVAYAAASENIPCVVVMPETAPKQKLEATRGYGAEVILHDDIRTIFDRTESVRKERGATLVHPFDDPDVIAGQGTVGLEIMEDVPDAEMVIAGIGGGALMSGISLAVKALNPKIQVVGVEPEGAAGMKQALQAGEPARLENISTIADGLAAPYVGNLPYSILRDLLDDLILVSDLQIANACKILLERTKLLVEPAGAACLAALLSGKIQASGKKVVLVLSGGNFDLKRLSAILSD